LEGLACNLAALDDQLYAILNGLVDEEAAAALAAQLHAGIIAATLCCYAGRILGAAGNTAFRLAASAKLVLRSGRLLLGRSVGVAAGFRAAARPPETAWQGVAVDVLLPAVNLAVELLRGSNAAGLRAFLATTAAPSVSIPWLEALLDVLAGMPRAAWGELGWRRSPAGWLS
jgi:hypothetical protein